MSASLSQDVALRIAMAAKALSNIEVKTLLQLLLNQLGEPLTQSKLAALSPKLLRNMFATLADSPTRAEIATAFAILTNGDIDHIDAPRVENATPLTGPKLRVAITSNQGEQLNGHFGNCLRVLVYEVNAQTSRLVEVRPVDTALTGEDRTQYIVSLLSGCQILFTLSIGGPAAARVTRSNIHPVKKKEAMPAGKVLSELSKVLEKSPPKWLQKAMELMEPEEEMV